ncbi:MAG: pyrroloquinoline quinone biosynthesis protein PqqB [Pseudomonadota bacterium]
MERGDATGRLRALVLGAGAGGGFPQWNCACTNCTAFWGGDAGLKPLTQSSLAATADGENWALLNASPDLRQQIIDNPALHPRKPLRHSPLVSVLLTNGDLDHIAGLLTLREKHPLRLFATEEILEVLRRNPVFDALDPALVTQTPVSLETPVEIAPGLLATLFAVPGKVPLFLEGDGPVETVLEGEFTVGVELRAHGRTAFYVPGCARVTPALAERLLGADLLLFDGTVYHDDEMIREGVGHKTGARMGHIAMAGEAGSLHALSTLGIERRVYVHINNTNPVIRPSSPERAAVEAAGWEIAADGLEIDLARMSAQTPSAAEETS